MAKVGTRFTAYNFMNTTMKRTRRSDVLSTSDVFVCMSSGLNFFMIVGGVFAGFVDSIVATTPMEALKVLFIDDRLHGSGKYKGLVSGVRSIVRENGLRYIYRGAIATAIKQGMLVIHYHDEQHLTKA